MVVVMVMVVGREGLVVVDREGWWVVDEGRWSWWVVAWDRRYALSRAGNPGSQQVTRYPSAKRDFAAHMYG